MDLGVLIGEYPVDNKRRANHGLVLTGVGVVALAVGIPILVADVTRPLGPGEYPSAGPDFLRGGLVAIGLLAFVSGVVLLIRALQTRGHTIHLHERGILRRAGDTEEAIPWSDIATVRLQGTEHNRAGHYLGIDFRCAIQLRNARRFAFSSHTTNATELAQAIHNAVDNGAPPRT